MSRILDVALDVSYLTGETDYILVHAREGQHDGEGRECVEPVVGVLVREWQLRAADALRVEQQVALGVLHGLRHPLVEERRRGGAGLGHGAQEREKKKRGKKSDDNYDDEVFLYCMVTAAAQRRVRTF
jgi:hypothetical protein